MPTKKLQITRCGLVTVASKQAAYEAGIIRGR
jgi:hypothetical protein